MTKLFPTLLVSTMALIGVGCGYSDYTGHPAHKTQKEAHLNSLSTVVTGYGAEYDGTYVYTARYNNLRWQKQNFSFKNVIKSYRNIVNNSYPTRPGVFVDGDKFNNARGFAGGTFKKYWVATDTDPDTVGGLDNFDQSHPLDDDGNWIEPGLILSIDGGETEIDAFDVDLQSSVKNSSDLLTKLVANGGSLDQVKMAITKIEFDGLPVSVEPYTIDVNVAGFSNVELHIKNQKNSKTLLNTIINNTEHLKPVDISLQFDNGMEFELPKKFQLMFNHNVLSKLAKQS